MMKIKTRLNRVKTSLKRVKDITPIVFIRMTSDSEPKIIVSFDIGIKNLAVCVMSVKGPGSEGEHGNEVGHGSKVGHGSASGIKILVWKVISLAAEKEKIPVMNEISGRLFLAMDELVDEIGQPIDYVILENQPSNLNGAMKSIQMMIYSYFQLRKHWEGLAKQVYLVSASEKLKGHETALSNIDMTKYEDKSSASGVSGAVVVKKTLRQKKSKSYQNNKKLAIDITKYYLSKNEELLSLFCSYKKMDDMADTFLQGISWIRKHGFENIDVLESMIANSSV